MKHIPSIEFKSDDHRIKGVEIIPLDKIVSKRKHLTHDPEKPHKLQFYNLIFYTGGQSQHLVDFEWYPVKKNTLVYLAKGQVNAFDFKPDLQAYCILFTHDYFEQCFSNISKELVFRMFNHYLFPPKIQLPEKSDFESYLELLRHELSNDTKFEKETIINSLFSILLVKMEELKQNQEDQKQDRSKVLLISKFSILVQDHFTLNRNADFYAKKLLVSYKHLNLCCKDILNKTAKQFIDDFIILEAKRRLINSEIKSTELAYSLGFEEPTNFTKYFKKKTGITPNSFKNIHK